MITRSIGRSFYRRLPNWHRYDEEGVAMRRILLGGIVLLGWLLFTVGHVPQIAHAWKPSLPSFGKKKETTKAVNMDELMAEGATIRILVAKAMESYLEGTGKILTAAGHKKGAVKFERAAEDLSKDREDPQKLKDTSSLIDEGNKYLEEILAQKAAFSGKARKALATGVAYVGAAGLADGTAGKLTADHLEKLKGAMEVVKEEPLKYGAGALAYLTESADLMTFLSTNLPKHADSISNTYSALVKYANTCGVQVSQADCDEQLKKLTVK